MITQFETYLTTIKRYSHNTALGYGKDLRAFARWMREQDSSARWSTIEREDIDKYMAMMTRAGRTPATINRHISAIRALYKYFQRQGWTEHNPAQYETMQKLLQRQANTIPASELQEIMDKASGTAGLIIRLLGTTGIRVQELLDITQSDIETANGRILIHGKGGKERHAYPTASVMKELASYAKGRGYKIFGDIDQRSVRAMVYNTMRHYSQARQLSPHAIRHTVATQMAKKGANVATIAAILGHESIKTTQKYIDMASINCQSAAQQYIQFN